MLTRHFERWNRFNLSKHLWAMFHCGVATLLIFAGAGFRTNAASAQEPSADNSTEFTADQIAFFEREVRPLLVEHCYECHSVKSAKLQAGLRVDSRSALLRGGDSGSALDLSDASQSLFMQAIHYEEYEMPPKGKLPDNDIATLQRWVDMGAPWPKEAEPTDTKAIPEFNLKARVAEHWMWRPILNPTRPDVSDRSWPLTEADHFILQALEKAGIQPAPPAENLAILRRIYFDLIGLPPTPEQIGAFLADDSDKALEHVVDQLLQSPHFGERWGRHWLDLVRYAESRGHEFDNDSPNAYQYRDYVIRALNADVPYDQFVREHIAGDLLSEPRLNPNSKANESVLGTGFWYMGEWVHSPVDIRKDEADRFDNMLDVMSKTFLGVTVACARCHDHKFDAISSKDYYALSGFLQSSDYRQVTFESLEQNCQVAKRLENLDSQYRQQLLQLLHDSGINPPAAEPSTTLPAGIIVDYSNVEEIDYIQDGFLFGSRPRKAGDLQIEEKGVVVNSYSAARNDPFWNDLKAITEGAIQNSSQLDQLPKAGRMLRTPTFELTHGEVSCLVEGRGHVVACVDSHRLIAGPLHGETIRGINENERWIKLNLSRYLGHRLHLEFIPAENATLAVRLVAQGLTEQARQELDSKFNQELKAFQEYANVVDAAFNGTQEPLRILFADFESGTYGDWKPEGTAFGTAPQSNETIAHYQGDVNHRGKYFINSHNIRKGAADTQAGDQLTGSLTSPEFTITFQELEFLIGGGAHAGKTCVNLLIDGQVALSATGKNNNRMEIHRWDVRPFAQKKAVIQIVDAHEGGWGNIGADEFCFIEIQTAAPPNSAASELIAEWRRERELLRKEAIFTSHTAPAMLDGTGEEDHVLIRGNSAKPGELQPRRFLEAIAGADPLPIQHGSGRLQLADSINDPQNPLTHRVIVNRIWHYLMGRGIVPTVDDFGVLGQRPTHPELLDHLASKFLADGRSLKRMIRYIVLSRAYQMSSHAAPNALTDDPNNNLWHYRPPKRLEGEAIRDALLAISGRIVIKQFGPPVPIHLTPFMDGRGRPNVNGPLDGDGRRSVYLAVRRNFLSPMMLAFDSPVPFSTMGRRNVSNVPAQALILMNDPLVLQQSVGWASRVMASSPDQEERIRTMYLMAFGRPPIEEELTIAKTLIANNGDNRSWSDLAHILVNTKEFIFLR